VLARAGLSRMVLVNVGGNTDPDFRKVGFGGFGDAQG
jgi:hypothetical protein